MSYIVPSGSAPNLKLGFAVQIRLFTHPVFSTHARLAQLEEATDLNPVQYEFESHSGYTRPSDEIGSTCWT